MLKFSTYMAFDIGQHQSSGPLLAQHPTPVHLHRSAQHKGTPHLLQSSSMKYTQDLTLKIHDRVLKPQTRNIPMFPVHRTMLFHGASKLILMPGRDLQPQADRLFFQGAVVLAVYTSQDYEGHRSTCFCPTSVLHWSWGLSSSGATPCCSICVPKKAKLIDFPTPGCHRLREKG